MSTWEQKDRIPDLLTIVIQGVMSHLMIYGRSNQINLVWHVGRDYTSDLSDHHQEQSYLIGVMSYDGEQPTATEGNLK